MVVMQAQNFFLLSNELPPNGQKLVVNSQTDEWRGSRSGTLRASAASTARATVQIPKPSGSRRLRSGTLFPFLQSVISGMQMSLSYSTDNLRAGHFWADLLRGFRQKDLSYVSPLLYTRWIREVFDVHHREYRTTQAIPRQVWKRHWHWLALQYESMDDPGNFLELDQAALWLYWRDSVMKNTVAHRQLHSTWKR